MFFYVENNFNTTPDYFLHPQRVNNNSYDIEYLGAPIFLLPDSMEKFYQLKGSKFWYNIKRAERQFQERFGQLSFLYITDNNSAETYLGPLRALFLQKWEKSWTSSTWQNDAGFKEFSEIFIQLMKEGQTSLSLLYWQDELLAFSCNLLKGDVFYFYQHAASIKPEYRSYSVGKLFLIKLFGHLIADKKYRIFDFMIGEDAYKLEWSTCIQKVYFRLQRNGQNRLIFRMSFLLVWLRIYLIKSMRLKTLLKKIMQFSHLRGQKHA